MLPGWNPGFIVPRLLRSLAQQATTSAGATSLTCPTVAKGDLIVVLSYATGSAAFVTPTGFTPLVQSVLGAVRQALSAKVADGTESGTTINGMTGSGFGMVLVTLRPDTPLVSFVLASPQGELTDGNPVAQNVTSGAGPAPLIVIGAYGSLGVVNPRTFSPAKDGEVLLGTGTMYIAWKNYFNSQVDVSIDMDDEGNGNALQSCYLRLQV